MLPLSYQKNIFRRITTEAPRLHDIGFEVYLRRLKTMAWGALATGMAFFGPDVWAQRAPENSTGCDPCPLTESFLIDLAFVQEKRTFQTTVSTEDHSTREGRDILMPISLEYGICDSWQLGVDWSAWGYFRADGESAVHGVGELELSTKHTFAMADPRNHLAAGFGFTIPTGKLGGDSIGFTPSLMFGRDFKNRHNLLLFSELSFTFVQRIGSGSEPALTKYLWVLVG